jgi:hypothetical protein
LLHRNRVFPSVSILAVVLAGSQWGGTSGQPAAVDSYYLVVFGCQDERSNPFTSHCFSTLIHVKAQRSRAPEYEFQHINWFTRRGHETGHPHGLLVDGTPGDPEPGENRDTACGFLGASKHKLTVYRFGPYEIEEDLYDRARKQVDLLEGRISGRKVLYKQLDYGLREHGQPSALNCIHAVSDIVREPEPLGTGLAFGRDAALLTVQHFKPWIKRPYRVHADVWTQAWPLLWKGHEPAPVTIVEGPEPPGGEPHPAQRMTDSQ